MKLTALLLTISFLQLQAKGLSQVVTLDARSASLKSVFNTIERQTGYVVFYSQQLISKTKPVTVHLKNTPLPEALELVFRNQPLSYDIRKEIKTIILSAKQPAAANSTAVMPQEAQPLPPPIRIQVTDTTGKPLANASVSVKGSNKSGMTNSSGMINMDLNAGDVIIISFVGYEPRNLVVTQSMITAGDPLVVVLKPSVANLDDVVVTLSTGYQKIPKERATGSFAQITDKKLYFTTLGTTDFTKGLEGQIAGLQVNANGTLEVRGVSSIRSDTRPLIVVDGFPIESENFTINNNDIQSITVLKDAAAASIWGVRASNGVVVIETKRGKNSAGKASVEFRSALSISSKPDLSYYQMANSADYIDFEVETINNKWWNPATADRNSYSLVEELYYKKYKGLIDDAQVADGLKALATKNKLNQSDLFYRNAVQQQYNLSLRGGTALHQYAFSTQYTKNLSANRGNGNDDIVLNLNNSIQLHPKVKLDLNVNTTHRTTDVAPAYSYNAGAPYFEFVDANGDYEFVSAGVARHLLNGYYNNGYLNWEYNPKQELDNANNRVKNLNLRMSAGLTYDILQGLTFASQYQYEWGNSQGENLQNANTYFARNLANAWRVYNATTKVYDNLFPRGSIYDITKSSLNTWTFRNSLNLNRTFRERHAVNAILGVEHRKRFVKGNSERYYNYNPQALTNDNYNVLALSNFTPNYRGDYERYTFSPAFVESDRRFFSMYFNGAYTFDRKYTASFSSRIDQSNLFGTDKRYRYRPIWSAGLSYQISEEKFWEHIKLVDYLNLRVTYGINGNIGNSSPYPIARTDKNFNTQENMLTYFNPENNQLRPEKTSVLNLATDFRLSGRKLYGSIDYYFKKSFDLLGNSVLDPTTGFLSSEVNTAKMVNRGVDISLNSAIIQRAFSMVVGINFGYNKNKVTESYQQNRTASTYVTGTAAIEGKPLSYLYSYRWAGLSANGTPQIFNEKNEVVLFSAPDMSNIDGLKYVGTLTPPFYGGLNFEFSYKGFMLQPMFTYKMGHVMRSPRPSTLLYAQVTDQIGNRWKKPGDEAFTNIPKVYTSASVPTRYTNYYMYSDVWDESASLIRLRMVTLSYDFPMANADKFFKNIRLTAQGNNLWLWTKNKSDIDPDFYNLKTGSFNDIPVKTFVLALNLNF